MGNMRGIVPHPGETITARDAKVRYPSIQWDDSQLVWCYDNGDMYQGEWDHDTFEGTSVEHGTGKMVNVSRNCEGLVYDGEWHEGELSGKGRSWWAPESQTWIENKTRGGPSLLVGGCRLPYTYEGRYLKDAKHGHGRLTLKDGRTWEGEFKAGDPVRFSETDLKGPCDVAPLSPPQPVPAHRRPRPSALRNGAHTGTKHSPRGQKRSALAPDPPPPPPPAAASAPPAPTAPAPRAGAGAGAGGGPATLVALLGLAERELGLEPSGLNVPQRLARLEEETGLSGALPKEEGHPFKERAEAAVVVLLGKGWPRLL